VDACESVEDVDELFFDQLGVGAGRQNRQQRFVGDEVEARECLFLLLELGVELALALLQLLLEVRQSAHDDVILAALLDVLDVLGEIHILNEVLVDLLEFGGFLRQTLDDVPGGKDRFEGRPERLDFVPLLDGALEVGEHVVEDLDLVHERRHELLRLQPAYLVLVVGQIVSDFGRAAEDPDGLVFLRSEVELLVLFPQIADFL